MLDEGDISLVARSHLRTNHISIPQILADVCIFGVGALSTGAWWQFSRMRFVAVIALVGLVALWSRARPTSKEVGLIIAFICCHAPVLFAVTLYGTLSELIYHFGFALFVFPFIQAYLNRYGVSRKAFVYSIVLSALPVLFPGFLSDANVSRLDIISTLEVQSRFTGNTGDPNYTSLYLAAPLAAALFLAYSKRPCRWFWFLISFVIAFSIFSTGSRAGFLAVVCTLLLFVFFSGKESKSVLLYLTLTLVLVGFAYGIIEPYVDIFLMRTGGGTRFFEDMRYEVWLAALDMILASPMINFISPEVFMGYYRIVVHNAWLDIGLTYGSLTMAIHVIVLVMGIFIFLRRYRISARSQISPSENLLVFTGMVCVPVLICASTLTVGTATIYWFIYALIWSTCFSVYHWQKREVANVEIR